MPDDLPPKEVFDVLLELFSIITTNTQKLPKGSSEYLIALVLLSSKAISHTHAALHILEKHRAIGECIILLRAAYEATVVFLYLIDHEESFQKYKGFSRLVEHRNQLEMLDIAAEDLLQEEINEQQFRNKAVADEIISNGYHILYHIDEQDVSNLEKLKKTTKKAHFIDFKTMLKHLEKDERHRSIIFGIFQGYNVSSQVAHSHYHVSISIYAYDKAPPAFCMNSICGQVRDIFCSIGIGLNKLGLFPPDVYLNKFKQHFLKTMQVMDIPETSS